MAGADTCGTVTTTVLNMRRLAVGLVTLLLLAGCTDDPTVSNDGAAQADTAETAVVSQPTPEPSPTPVPPPAPEAPAATASDDVEASEPESENDGLFPIVVDATASTSDGTSWRVNVTLSSEYDSPARYADAWRVLDADDNELGIRVLGHDHANEQPFTRSHTVEIPSDMTTVFIEGRDQLNGWSGERFELNLAR